MTTAKIFEQNKFLIAFKTLESEITRTGIFIVSFCILENEP